MAAPKNHTEGTFMAKAARAVDKLPGAFGKFAARFPEVFQGYEAMGRAAHAGGPLDAKTRELVKLGMTIGAKSLCHQHLMKH